MLKNIRYSFRLVAIALQLARCGLLPWRVARRPVHAERVARTFERLGPSFIKLGQTLSTRADLIGEELASSLSTLRDQLPPFPTAQVKRIIEAELGQPVEALFAEFEEQPVAAASVAQVHRAHLNNGRAVAVKIVRPGVRRAFARDFAFFYWCARLLERRMPSARRLKPLEVVRTLERTVAFELDMRYEAAAIVEMERNIRADTGWRVPGVDWDLTAGRVLVTEWIDGIAIHEAEALKAAGHDVNAVLTGLAEHFFKHVFRDGFFHADLHPGNVFVDSAGNIAVVDFGIMGRLQWKERMYVAEIFRGFLNEDYRHVAEAHFKAGYIPPHQSVEQFAQAAMAIAKPILGHAMHEVSLAKLLGHLFAVSEAFEMETQPQLLLLQRTMVVVEGLGRMLNPSVNMWELARPPIEAWAREHLSAKARVKHTLLEAFETLADLPEALRQLHKALAAWTARQNANQ